MNTLTVVVMITLMATALALVSGIVSMAQGGEFDKRHSHQFMLARVALQGLTLALIIAALLLSLH